MNSLTVRRPVVIKVKVTEEFKRKIAAELQFNLNKIESDIQSLEFQNKRLINELEKQNPQGIPAARQHLENQRNKKLETKNQLLEKIKEVGTLSIGSEIVHGTIESVTDIKVGDNWLDILGVEIIVQDDVIVEIRGRN